MYGHPVFSSESSFTPLFRLLDDFEAYNQSAPSGFQSRRRQLNFNPRFDMRETENSFELHGELPGIAKENISIDFTDPQTVVIKGKVERSYETNTPPAGSLTGASAPGAITESGEDSAHKPHKTTVEDVGEDGEGATEQQQVVRAEEKQPAQQQKQQPKARFWYSERSVGEFCRTFAFPTPVDREEVTASLKDGILHVSVPKAKKPASRRIAIQ